MAAEGRRRGRPEGGVEVLQSDAALRAVLEGQRGGELAGGDGIGERVDRAVVGPAAVAVASQIGHAAERGELEERRRDASGRDPGELDVSPVERRAVGRARVLRDEQAGRGADRPPVGCGEAVESQIATTAERRGVRGAFEGLSVDVVGADAAGDFQAGVGTGNVEEALTELRAHANILDRRGLPRRKIGGNGAPRDDEGGGRPEKNGRKAHA